MVTQLSGSRTIFNTPTPEFIDYALKLQEYILKLSNKPLEYTYGDDWDIVDTEKGGKAFCKGIYVKDINAFFSYNFNNADLNPDRNEFTGFSRDNDWVRILLSRCDNYQIIKKTLSKILEYYDNSEKETESENMRDLPYECNVARGLKEMFNSEYAGFNEKYRGFLWKKAFDELFKQEIQKSGLEGVVLKTDYEVPDYLKETLKKYKIINLPKDWVEALSIAGVKTEKDIIPDYFEEKVPTSLTLDYGAELWDTERILLDACQNHLPADSGGNNIFLRFQTKDGIWHDYKEFEKFENDEIKKIKISDDGRGYDYKSLGLFASIKEHQDSSGKWGEGLKMIAASAIRNGVNIEFSSRNWKATPYTEKEVLNQGEENEKEVQRLNFAVKINEKEDKNSLHDGDNLKDEKSATTFIDPTPELIKEFRNIKDKVLVFSNEKPMFSLDDIDILDMFGGQLYVKNVLIPGDHETGYTYHLKDFDIETRDRDAIKKDSMQSQIRKVFENIKDERFIKMFLMQATDYAKKPGEKNFLEFNTNFYIPSRTENADVWIKAFQEYFGEDACVRKMSSQDYMEAAQAEHMGLETITLPDGIANALLDLEGRDGKKLPSYMDSLNEAIENAIPLNEKDLTPTEKALVQQLYKYNDILFLSKDTINKITQINVYDYEPDYSGKRAAGYAGFGDTVHISRETLEQGLERATDVFLHEVGHAQTGAKDAAPEFRNYQTGLSAAVITKLYPLEESIIDNGLAKNIRFPKFKNAIKKLFWKVIGEENKTVKDNNDIEVGDY